jgi:hypothetical protein
VKTLADWVASSWCFGQPIRETHSAVEWILVGIAAGTVVYAFYQAVLHTLYPGETSIDHVKRRILDDERDSG